MQRVTSPLLLTHSEIFILRKVYLRKLNNMAQDENPNLQKYFENDPPSFFDELADDSQHQTASVSNEVRDIWPHPKAERYSPVVPRVSVDLLNDPLAQAVTTHIPSELSKRKTAQTESLTVDDRGIKSLIEDKCYRGAIALTGRLLTNYGQGFQGNSSFKHSSHSLQLWHARIALLMKINELEIAKNEAEAFGQLSNPDLFYQHQHSQTFKSVYGSMASFSFRLLLASELPLRLNKPQEALNNLQHILNVTSKIHKFFVDLQKPNESDFWKARKIRVLSSMINCAMHLKNFDLVHQLYQTLLDLPGHSSSTKFSLTSAWGRTYLLCGDIPSAEAQFKLLQPTTSVETVRRFIDKGLVAVAQSDYEEAYQQFQKAHEIEKNNILIMNNMAVCFLYTGKMHEAIKLYEQAINLDPKKNINEALLLNCSTLYELESNESKKKKIDLLKLVSANRADIEMTVENCLKL